MAPLVLCLDPVYLASVRVWYDQIGEQLKGLLWKDGGPVLRIPA